MASQHVYYNGDDRYETLGQPYSEGAYYRPVDQYYGPFGGNRAPADGRNPPQRPGMQPYLQPGVPLPNPNGMPSRQKRSKREDPDPRMQGHTYYNGREDENGDRPKNGKSEWESDTDPTDGEKDQPKPKGVARLFDKHTDKFSMSGVSYIKSTKNPWVKFVWSALLILAVGAMAYHLYRLISTYLDYKKQTSVELSFDTLKFPAVTICNVNPFRMSQINLASDDLISFVDNVDPTQLTDDLNNWDPEFDNIDDYYDDDFDDDILLLIDRKRRRKRQASTSSQVRSTNFLDEVDIGINDTRQWQETLDSYYSESDPDSWEAQANVSAFYEAEQTFKELFAWEWPNVRAQMGHQISDMLLQCSFAGRQCLARNFTRLLTTDYGNCYTLQYDKFLSRKSGPKYGLELKLFLETDEYVPGIANSKGIQVVIHDQGTQPFPEDEGIAVKAGTETRIGLRMVTVSRLNRAWSKCSSPEEFRRTYNVKYTRTACQNVCLYRKTVDVCNCYNILSEETRKLFRRLRRNATACESDTEIRCAEKVANQFESDSDDCECHSPCSETSFRHAYSSRQWPTADFANLLVETVCKNNHPECGTIRTKSDEDKRSEFIRLVIYYEDLNFEKLTESAAYEIDQFLSDIGGTIGLYIGLSVLAIFEVIHLLTDIMIYLCCGRCRNKSS